MARLCQIDAFSAVPLAGNGAAVVVLEAPAPQSWMQALASETAQSETAFLWKAGGHWLLRWFTPSCEVELCGHATLAAACALARQGLLEEGVATELISRSGPLTVTAAADQFSAILPSGRLRQSPPELSSGHLALAELLGTPLHNHWTSSLGYEVVELADPAVLPTLKPHQAALANRDAQALVVMAKGGPARTGPPTLSPEGEAAREPEPPRQGAQACSQPWDYSLRFFAPRFGIPEDPVTGSAHALVAPLWCQRLGRREVHGWQPSHRPGGMTCTTLPPAQVRLAGPCTLVWSGELLEVAQQPDEQGWRALQMAAAALP